jgi:hypothetical protein
MISYKIIKKDKVSQFLSGIVSSGKMLMAPEKKGDKYYFSHIEKIDKVPDDYRFTELSTKSAFFPRCEELLSYKKEEKDIKINDSKIPEKDVVVYGFILVMLRQWNIWMIFSLRKTPMLISKEEEIKLY